MFLHLCFIVYIVVLATGTSPKINQAFGFHFVGLYCKEPGIVDWDCYNASVLLT